MSFFSGSTSKIPQSNPKPLGLDAKTLPTNQRTIPVPLAYGLDRLSVFYLTGAFDHEAIPVEQEVGKKSDPIISGYNYFASFAAGVCHGPVDELQAIYFDDVKVWPPEGGGPLLRDVSNPVSAPITIEGWGTWEWYWGTESQGVDPTLDAIVGETHSGYVGLCYFVATRQLLGYQKTSVPKIEVVVGRYLDKHFTSQGEVSTWLTTTKIGTQLNPMAAVVDALVNSRYGLSLRDVGSSDTWLDRAGIQAAADVFSTEGLGISGSVFRQQSFDQFLVSLLETVDAFYFPSAAGRISFQANRAPATGTELPELDEVAIVGTPQLTNPTWLTAATGVTVAYRNGQNDYVDDAARAPNASALIRVGEPNEMPFERPWVRDPNIASKLAHVIAKVLGHPARSGSVRIRESQRQGILPGSRFLLHWDQWSVCNLQCVCTAVSKGDPFQPALDIEFEVDRAAQSRTTYAVATYSAPVKTVLASPAIVHFRPIELPYSPHLREAPRIGFLIARPSRTATRWQVKWQSPGGSYKTVKSGQVWAYHGTLAADYSKTATGYVEINISTPDLAADLPAVSSLDAQEDRWLLLVAKSDGLDELMAIHTKVAVDSDTVRYSVLRERFDSAKRDHTAGDECFLFPLGAGSSGWQLEGDGSEGAEHTFKPQSVVVGSISDIDDATAVSVTLTERGRRPWKPKAVTCSATYNDSTTVTISWTKQHREGNDGQNPTGSGVVWVIEVRDAAADPTSTPPLKKLLAYHITTWSWTGAIIEAAIGGPVDARITIYADDGGYRSRHSDEFIVTRV